MGGHRGTDVRTLLQAYSFPEPAHLWENRSRRRRLIFSYFLLSRISENERTDARKRSFGNVNSSSSAGRTYTYAARLVFVGQLQNGRKEPPLKHGSRYFFLFVPRRE